MDNKLSELSKPVFEIEVSGGHWLNCSSGKLTPDAGADFTEWPDGINRLYSQEYVSALLADNEAKDKRIAEAEVRGVEKLAAAFKSWASDETFPDCEAQRHWATASREALSFAGDLRNGICDDR
jgi:hypothetical protein